MQKFEFLLSECEISNKGNTLIIEAENAINEKHISAEMDNFPDIFLTALIEFASCKIQEIDSTTLEMMADNFNEILTAIIKELQERQEEERAKNAKSIQDDEAQMFNNQWCAIRW